MRDFRSLLVWQKAHALTLGVYRVTKAFPREERYGLTAQLRRAASSIATNVAEGCGRASKRDFAHFLSIAAGSTSEAEYQLLLARDLEYLPDADYEQLTLLATGVKKMLGALHRSVAPPDR